MANTHYKVQGKALALCNAFGFLFPGELCLIQAIARSLPAGAIAVNIGAGVGTGSLALAEINPGLNLFTVDISKGGPEGGFENEKNAFEGAGISPLPVQILGASQEVYANWPLSPSEPSIDYLFIDGDHAESALRGDIAGWCPLVKIGGYVLFHDYESVHWDDVTKVVKEVMFNRSWKLILKVDTLIAFQKVK